MTNVVGLPDEATTIAAAQAGDRRALDRLLRAHQPAVYAVCRRITGNDADALDATQEALVSLVRSIDRFDGRSKFSTWAYRIATNAALDELRRRGRRPLTGLPDDHDPSSPAPDLAPDLADEVVVHDEVDTALAQLRPEFRAVVVLRDLLQLDYAEIAEVLELPPGTVRSRIARGRGQLADLLTGNQSSTPERPTTEP